MRYVKFKYIRSSQGHGSRPKQAKRRGWYAFDSSTRQYCSHFCYVVYSTVGSRTHDVDVFGWPKSQCMFPAWTTRSRWHDITGRHVYSTNDMGDIIDVGYRSSATSPVETSTSLRCFRILARNTTASHISVIAFAVTGCSARYQCVSFVKRKDFVIELHQGWPTADVKTHSLGLFVPFTGVPTVHDRSPSTLSFLSESEPIPECFMLQHKRAVASRPLGQVGPWPDLWI